MVTKEKPVSQVADVAEADTTVYEYKDRVHYPDNVSADTKGLVGVSFL